MNLTMNSTSVYGLPGPSIPEPNVELSDTLRGKHLKILMLEVCIYIIIFAHVYVPTLYCLFII